MPQPIQFLSAKGDSLLQQVLTRVEGLGNACGRVEGGPGEHMVQFMGKHTAQGPAEEGLATRFAARLIEDHTPNVIAFYCAEGQDFTFAHHRFAQRSTSAPDQGEGPAALAGESHNCQFIEVLRNVIIIQEPPLQPKPDRLQNRAYLPFHFIYSHFGWLMFEVQVYSHFGSIRGRDRRFGRGNNERT